MNCQRPSERKSRLHINLPVRRARRKWSALQLVGHSEKRRVERRIPSRHRRRIQNRARIYQIHIIEHIALIDAQRNAVALRRGVAAQRSGPAATKRIRAASAPAAASATAAPSPAASPSATAALICRPEIKRLCKPQVQREMVRPRKRVYGNRYPIHTRQRIEIPKYRNSDDRAARRSG